MNHKNPELLRALALESETLNPDTFCIGTDGQRPVRSLALSVTYAPATNSRGSGYRVKSHGCRSVFIGCPHELTATERPRFAAVEALRKIAFWPGDFIPPDASDEFIAETRARANRQLIGSRLDAETFVFVFIY